MTYKLPHNAYTEDGNLVISIPFHALATAARLSDYFFDCANNNIHLVIPDEVVFAESVCNALNLEEEDGSTPITKILDDAIEWVSEQGEPGIEEE